MMWCKACGYEMECIEEGKAVGGKPHEYPELWCDVFKCMNEDCHNYAKVRSYVYPRKW